MKKSIKKAPSLKEQVYNYLREAIINDEFEMGKLYSDQWVADQLGVSRTPVREAVQQLKHEGLLEVVPYKGFKVKTLSETEINEVFEVRDAIEGFCIKKLIKNQDTREAKELLEKLEKIIAEQKKSYANNSRRDFWDTDRLFHSSIVSFSNNRILEDVYRSMGDKIKSIALETLRDETRLNTAFEEHVATLQYIKDGLINEAYEMNLRHLNNTKSLVMKALQKNKNSNN
ncbi:MAG: hypothetical protein PWQ96_1688 [Clostridia bacterium]|jgi:DNA-binding GntR family transcriptional regulator|nr:GntR-family transcriptional regulator [Clostridiales bacterium]MDK2986045.1 hypothetical protein [Clostridia bacterium]